MTSRTVDLADREDFVGLMNAALRIQPTRTAVLTIDMHRGHLDPEIATMRVRPDVAAQMVRRTAVLLRAARSRGLTVMHSITVRRPLEVAVPHPFPRLVGENGETLAPGLRMDPAHHNLAGSPQCEPMPGLGVEASDLVLAGKKQFSSFVATELANLVRLAGIDTLVLTGVGTNTCVLSTALDAYNLGLRVVVVADCTTSLNGDDLHLFALENIRRTIGWVIDAAALPSLCESPDLEVSK